MVINEMEWTTTNKNELYYDVKIPINSTWQIQDFVNNIYIL